MHVPPSARLRLTSNLASVFLATAARAATLRVGAGQAYATIAADNPKPAGQDGCAPCNSGVKAQ